MALLWGTLLRYGQQHIPNSKVHGANMGSIWGRQDPGGPHVGPMNFAIWDVIMVAVDHLALHQDDSMTVVTPPVNNIDYPRLGNG